jgi:hypothetical protein
MHTGFWWENRKESPLGRPKRGLEDNTKWILEKYDGVTWNGSGKRQVAGSCEHGNEPSGSIKCWGNS